MRVFVQGENIEGIQMIEVGAETTVSEILNQVQRLGLPPVESGEEFSVWLEDEPEPLSQTVALPLDKIEGEARIHCHRCKHVTVFCSYNNDTKSEAFPPSSTIRTVKKWFTGHKGFHIPEADAAELVLQLRGTTDQPETYVHIGSLVKHSHCSLCLDLVNADRPQG